MSMRFAWIQPDAKATVHERKETTAIHARKKSGGGDNGEGGGIKVVRGWVCR